MQSRGAEMPDWWDDELDMLLKQCLAAFGEDAADDAVIGATERYCGSLDVDDVLLREALVPALVEAIKSEFRRLLTPH